MDINGFSHVRDYTTFPNTWYEIARGEGAPILLEGGSADGELIGIEAGAVQQDIECLDTVMEGVQLLLQDEGQAWTAGGV